MIKKRNALSNLNPYVPGKPIDDVKKELGLTEIIKLASNENPLGCSEKVVEKLKDCFDVVNLYPDGNCTVLREKLAKHLNVSEDNLLFGCGTDEVISMLALAYMDTGDEAITAEITFPQYASAVTSYGGKMIYTPMKNYGYDLDAIVNAITDKTRIIFIANPNNPTGTAFFEEEQKEFLKRIPSNILVVLDEAYCEYVENPNYPNSIPLLKKYENVVILRTFSKIYGLASMRIGYGIMNPSIAVELNKIRKPFNVSTFAITAAAAALDDKEFLKRSHTSNKEAKEFAIGKLDKLGLFYIPTHGNFIMIDTKKDSSYIFKELMSKGIIIRPGAAFSMPTFLRVTLGTVDEMKIFFDALEEIL